MSNWWKSRNPWLLISLHVVAVALLFGSSVPLYAQTTLDVWGIWSSGAAYDAIHTIIEKYEAENPDVTVEYNVVSWREYLDKTIIAHATDTAPDVLFLADEWVEVAYRAGVLGPLPSPLEHEVRQVFFPNPLQMGEREGRLYGIPTEFNVYGLVWNEALFQESGIPSAPETWDEMQDYARRLTRWSGDSISQAGLYLYFDHASEIVAVFNNLLATNGHEGFVDDLTQLSLNDTVAVETLQFLQDLYLHNRVWAPDAPDYSTGRLAMRMDHYGHSGNLRSEFPELFEASHITSLPRNRGDHANLYWGWIATVPSRSANTDAAWDFVQYFTNSENTRLFADAMGFIITRKDTLHDFRDHWTEAEHELIAHATVHAAYHPAWNDVYDIAGPLLSQAIQGDISPFEALETITTRVRAVASEADSR